LLSLEECVELLLLDPPERGPRERRTFEECTIGEAADALEHRGELFAFGDGVDTGPHDLAAQDHRPSRLELGAYRDLVERLQEQIVARIAAPRLLQIDREDPHRQVRPTARNLDALAVRLGQEPGG